MQQRTYGQGRIMDREGQERTALGREYRKGRVWARKNGYGKGMTGKDIKTRNNGDDKGCGTGKDGTGKVREEIMGSHKTGMDREGRV